MDSTKDIPLILWYEKTCEDKQFLEVHVCVGFFSFRYEMNCGVIFWHFFSFCYEIRLWVQVKKAMTRVAWPRVSSVWFVIYGLGNIHKFFSSVVYYWNSRYRIINCSPFMLDERKYL
jgi:hypothetical protein